MLLEIIALIFLLILSGIFSGSEVALVSLSTIRVRTLIRKKRKGSNALKILKQHPDKMIITILVGNNLANISASVLGTIIATQIFGSSGAGIAIGALTFLVLVFGEITPKSYASTHAETFALWISPPLLFLQRALYPVVLLFEFLTKIALRFFTKKTKRKIITEDDIQTALDLGKEEKSIEHDEHRMMKRVLQFNDITTKQVMTPRHKMFCLDANMIVKDAIPILAKSSFSRTPLFLGSLDNIVGVVHKTDLLEAITEKEQNLPLKEIAVKPFFVNEKVIIDDLFKMFQERHNHLAIVIGMKGHTVGLITIEDLIEELVGEIIDESDVTPNKIMRIDSNSILVDGETSPKYVNSFFQTDLPEDMKTINEVLIKKNKKMPHRGQEMKMGSYVYLIEEVGIDYIERVLVRKK